MFDQAVTFVAEDPPRSSWFALWDPDHLGGLGADTDTTLEVAIPAKRGAQVVTVSASRIPIADAIDALAGLKASEVASRSGRVWAHVVRGALSAIAAGKLLPWVSPDGWDTWRIDPLDESQQQLVSELSKAMPAEGHATVAAGAKSRAKISDPTFAIRSAYDAVADAFVRTPAAHRVSKLAVFAAPSPTRVKHLRPWVSDLAAAHCSSCHLVLRMHPPTAPTLGRGGEPEVTVGGGAQVVLDSAESAMQLDRESSLDDPEHSRLATAKDTEQGDWYMGFALQSSTDPSLVIEATDFWTAPNEVMDRLGRESEATLLCGLRLLSELVEPVSAILEDPAPVGVDVPPPAIESIFEHLETLELANIEVRWPTELVAPRVQRQLLISAGPPSSARKSVLDLESALEVRWEFLLEGLPLTVEEMDVLAHAKRSVVMLRGRWVRVDAVTRKRLTDPAPRIELTQALAAALGAELDLGHDASLGQDDTQDIEVKIGESLAEWSKLLDSLHDPADVEPPRELCATLRPYQHRGLAWMSRLVDLGLGGCLADDMGLGKTVQILALHARLAQRGPLRTLVICPTSLIENWRREVGRFLPDTNVLVFHGPGRSLVSPVDQSEEAGAGGADSAQLGAGGMDSARPGADGVDSAQLGAGEVEGEQAGNDALGIASGIVITTYGIVRADAALLDRVGWGLVIADEAQNAKNPRSRTAKALRSISRGTRIALTGTPVENQLSELWAIFDWAVPGLLGRYETFRRTTSLPIERDGDSIVAGQLKRLLGPFLLRRSKNDPMIAPELPDKIERDVTAVLTAEQVTLYRAATDNILAEIAASDGIARRGLVLKLLTALKQIANHPAQYLGQAGPIARRSGKIALLEDLLNTAGGAPTLIFTQYVAMARLIQAHLAVNYSVGMLHGGLGTAPRQRLVDAFQDRTINILVLSLKAGGTGLNLTAATNVIHYDRWWNPAVEDQATDRAYRIGQTNKVTVHRLVTAGTIEDKVAALLKAKRELADMVIASKNSAGESWISDLNDDELAELVSLEGRTAYGTSDFHRSDDG